MHLLVGVLGYVVRYPPGEEWPLDRVAGEVVVLHVLLARQQHLELHLHELLPEGESCFSLGNEFVLNQLGFDRALVLVVDGVPVLLDVPHRVHLVDVSIRGDLDLMEAPVWVLLPRVAERLGRVEVD